MSSLRPTFLDDPTLQILFDVLDHKRLGHLRIVGGAVRNHILEMADGDIDLACSLAPDDVMRICKAAGLKVIPTGYEHGTVTVVIKGVPYEVTSLREDIETDGRHAIVRYGQSWEADARRRDFTMNALYMDCDGQIFDPLDTGLTDAKDGLVRFVGNPTQRIKEDCLRIMRFYRFNARYAKTSFDEAGAKACGAHVDLLQNLSKERVTDEFMKMCIESLKPSVETIVRVDKLVGYRVEQFVKVIKEMINHRVFEVLGISRPNVDALQNVAEKQIINDVAEPLFLFYFLCGGDLETLFSALVLSNKHKELLRQFDAALKESDMSHRELLYRFGRTVAVQTLLVKGEDVKITLQEDIPVFPIKGKDLLDHGFEEGPDLGRILKEAETWWIQENFMPDHDACIIYSKQKAGV